MSEKSLPPQTVNSEVPRRGSWNGVVHGPDEEFPEDYEEQEQIKPVEKPVYDSSLYRIYLFDKAQEAKTKELEELLNDLSEKEETGDYEREGGYDIDLEIEQVKAELKSLHRPVDSDISIDQAEITAARNSLYELYALRDNGNSDLDDQISYAEQHFLNVWEEEEEEESLEV